MKHTCKKCNETKDLIEFPVNNQLILGVRNECKVCRKIFKKIFYNKNKEKIKIKCATYYKENKEKIKILQKNYYLKNKEILIQYSKTYQLNNKDIIKEKNKNYYLKNKEHLIKCSKKYNILNADKRAKNEKIKQIDPVYKLKIQTRKNISYAFYKSGYTKKSKTFEILGCEYDFFKNYIEAQFKKGMQWDNIHLDHIKPISIAKTEKEVIELNHYTNFQPLFAKDNLQKGTNLITKQLRLI